MNIKIQTIHGLSKQLLDSFDTMEQDTYLKGSFAFRRRGYRTASIKNGQVHWDEKVACFTQSTEINKYVGGMERRFHPIAPSLLSEISNEVVLKAYNLLPPKDYSVGVHQIRILANEDHPGKPTPEGIHQDGFDYVAVMCVNTKNVSGGNSLLLDAKDHSKVMFEQILEPGTQIVFSDRTYAHYTSNICPKLPGIAYRDVFVATYKNLTHSQMNK